MLALLAAALVSAADGVAQWLSREGAGLVRNVPERGELPAPGQVRSALAATRSARQWQPWSPELAGQEGTLNLILGLHEGTTDDAVAFAAAAEASYQWALRYRPSSGRFWSGLATARLLARQLNAGFESALQRGMVFGGWDPATRMQLLWLGMSAWTWLDEGVRGELRALVRRGLGQDETRVMEMAIAAGWTAELRPLLPGAAKQRKLDRLLEESGSRSGGQ